MKLQTTILILFISIFSFGQSRIDSLFTVADNQYKAKDYSAAKVSYEGLKLELEKGTNDYSYATDQIAMIYFNQREDLRSEGKYLESIQYIQELMEYIENEKEFIRPFWFKEKRYFLIKTIVQNYFALGEIGKAKKYQEILYQAYHDKKLPEGIDEYYSFEMFKWEDKNVWGYEWFPELGDPKAEGSFSKIVYFVYSTDEKGQDLEQLFRLHVLKVHKIDDKVDDYVLTKRLETAKNEVSGTLWSYTYDSPIDFKKLRKDIKEVLKGNYETSATSIIRKTKKN